MAIALDTSTSVDTSGVGPFNLAITTSGTNRVLIVYIGIEAASPDKVTGVTYNGVAMTLLGKAFISTGPDESYLYALVNPTIGANNVTVTVSATVGFINISAVNYTGASQSAVPSNVVTNQTGTNQTVSITSAVSTSWVVGTTANDGTASVVTITNGTIRQNPNGSRAQWDSGGTVSGTTAFNASATTAGHWAVIGAELLVAGGGAVATHFLSSTGVGS